MGATYLFLYYKLNPTLDLNTMVSLVPCHNIIELFKTPREFYYLPVSDIFHAGIGGNRRP